MCPSVLVFGSGTARLWGTLRRRARDCGPPPYSSFICVGYFVTNIGSLNFAASIATFGWYSFITYCSRPLIHP